LLPVYDGHLKLFQLLEKHHVAQATDTLAVTTAKGEVEKIVANAKPKGWEC